PSRCRHTNRTTSASSRSTPCSTRASSRSRSRSTSRGATPGPTPRADCLAVSKQWPEMAEFMGAAYLRYSFTKGTEQEVAFLAGVLGLEAGQRVLDGGSGPGRHARALGRRGGGGGGVERS